jgi:type I restriction enzyme S subunit
MAIDPTFLNVGSASPTLNRNHVHPLKVRWPCNLSEQQAIAEVLGALDDKIAANDRIVRATDDICAALFTRLSIACGWGTLKEIAIVNAAVTQPAADGQLRYLDISSVSVGGYDFPPIMQWEDAPGRARRVLNSGDTVWSTVRPNRKSHALVLDGDANLIASTGIAVISPNSGRIASVYESTRTDEFVKYLESVAEGSAYPAVRGDRFNDAPVPAMRNSDWDHFESIALPLRKRAHAAARETRSLVATRDELLPLLMSGKIRVKDAEKVAEEVV